MRHVRHRVTIEYTFPAGTDLSEPCGWHDTRTIQEFFPTRLARAGAEVIIVSCTEIDEEGGESPEVSRA